MKAKPLHYFESLAWELHAQEARIRDLIGSKHWLTDGHHKEALLRGLLGRHVPNSILVAQGFLVPENDESMTSREQDILLLDAAAEMPLFYANGTAIASPRLLLAAIAVKSGFDTGKLRDATTCLGSVPELPFNVNSPWFGVFFFQPPDNVELQAVARSALAAVMPKTGDVKKLPAGEVTMRLGPDLLVVTSQTDGEKVARAYRCVGLSTAYFLARLLNVIALRRGAVGTSFADALDAIEGNGLEVAEVKEPNC